MRYWVYKDSRILGPLSAAELPHVEGASADLLICPEGADGSRESDWRTAGEMPELAAHFPVPSTSVGVLEAEPGDFEDWPIHGLSSEEIDSLRQFPSWGPGPWVGPPVRQREAEQADKRVVEDLQAKSRELESTAKELQAQKQRGDELEARVRDLESEKEKAAQALTKLQELEQRLAEQERQQQQILERLSAKDTELQQKNSELQQKDEEIRRLREEIDALRAAPPQAPQLTEPPPMSVAPSPFHAAEPSAPEPSSPTSGADDSPVKQVPLRLTGFSAPADEPKVLDIPPAVSIPPAIVPPAAVPFSIEPLTVTPIQVETPMPTPAPMPAFSPMPQLEPAPAAASALAGLVTPTPMPMSAAAQNPPPATAGLPPLPTFQPLTPGPASAAFGEAAPEPGKPPLPESPSAGLAALAASPTPMPAWAGSSFAPQQDALKTPDPFALPRTMITPVDPAKAVDAMPPMGSPAKLEGPLSMMNNPPPPPPPPPAPATTGADKKATSSAAPEPVKSNRSKKAIVLGAVFTVVILVVTAVVLKVFKSTSPASGSRGATDDLSGPSSGATGGISGGGTFGSRPQPSPAGSGVSSGGYASPAAGGGYPSTSGGNLPSGSARPTSSTPSSLPGSFPSQPAPTGSPAPGSYGASPAPGGRDFIPDRRQEAIQLVKDYPLGADRHNIADWLQYSFLTPGTKESWSANPGEGSGVYLVQYQASQDGQATRQTEPIVYLFEANVERRSVRGFNAAAKQLLGAPAASSSRPTTRPASTARPGSASDVLITPPSEADSQPVSRPAPRPVSKPRKHRTLQPGEIPQLPLPSDGELRHKKPSGSE